MRAREPVNNELEPLEPLENKWNRLSAKKSNFVHCLHRMVPHLFRRPLTVNFGTFRLRLFPQSKQ